MSFDPDKKIIPIGISDFKEFFDYNYYYIDKTILIKDILDTRSKVCLITRPRRFGKTLNLSMLKYFFENTEYKNQDNSYLFKDLNIWAFGERYIKHQGKYPVISLTFKGAKMNTWDETYIDLIRAISEEYKRHSYLLKQKIFELEEEQNIFFNICKQKAKFSDYISSIKNLCVYLEKYWGQKPIILIDEYDVPIQNSYLCGFYNETINFIRALLQAALKDNNYLEFAIITGCLRVSKESIFTGLNNLDIYSILDNRYSEHFGFTQEEINNILSYYNLEDKKQIIKDWYNGYQFGEKNIYNPWSILKYISQLRLNIKKHPEAYWVNTSGNDIIKKLIKTADNNTKNQIEVLINSGSIRKALNYNITYNELDENSDNIWSMLFFTGYLTFIREIREENDEISYFDLKIPNRELMYVYKTIIKHWFEEKIKSKNFDSLYDNIINGDEENLSDEISDLLLENISYHDANESFYHGILTGILTRIDQYRLYSNLETGLGRSDIILAPNRLKQPAIIIELKTAKNEDELENKCQEALEQIEKNKYDMYLRKENFKNIIKYGIAFCGKRCFIKKA